MADRRFTSLAAMGGHRLTGELGESTGGETDFARRVISRAIARQSNQPVSDWNTLSAQTLRAQYGAQHRQHLGT